MTPLGLPGTDQVIITKPDVVAKRTGVGTSSGAVCVLCVQERLVICKYNIIFQHNHVKGIITYLLHQFC